MAPIRLLSSWRNKAPSSPSSLSSGWSIISSDHSDDFSLLVSDLGSPPHSRPSSPSSVSSARNTFLGLTEAGPSGHQAVSLSLLGTSSDTAVRPLSESPSVRDLERRLDSVKHRTDDLRNGQLATNRMLQELLSGRQAAPHSAEARANLDRLGEKLDGVLARALPRSEFTQRSPHKNREQRTGDTSSLQERRKSIRKDRDKRVSPVQRQQQQQPPTPGFNDMIKEILAVGPHIFTPDVQKPPPVTPLVYRHHVPRRVESPPFELPHYLVPEGPEPRPLVNESLLLDAEKPMAERSSPHLRFADLQDLPHADQQRVAPPEPVVKFPKDEVAFGRQSSTAPNIGSQRSSRWRSGGLSRRPRPTRKSDRPVINDRKTEAQRPPEPEAPAIKAPHPAREVTHTLAAKEAPQSTPEGVALPTATEIPPFDDLVNILREERLAAVAAVDQQRELARYMRGLNLWLERDIHDRQVALQGMSARVERLGDELGHLGTSLDRLQDEPHGEQRPPMIVVHERPPVGPFLLYPPNFQPTEVVPGAPIPPPGHVYPSIPPIPTYWDHGMGNPPAPMPADRPHRGVGLYGPPGPAP